MLRVMDIQQEVKSVEKELLEIMLQNLQKYKINTEEAQKMALDFLTALPITDQQDLLNKLKAFGEKHPEAQSLYVNEITKVTNQKRDEALTRIRQAIHQGDMNSAIQIAKSYQKE